MADTWIVLTQLPPEVYPASFAVSAHRGFAFLLPLMTSAASEPIRIRLPLTGNGPYLLCPINPYARLAQFLAKENIETTIQHNGKARKVEIRL